MILNFTNRIAKQSQRFKAVRDIGGLLRPQLWLLAAGLFLMAVNRLSRLVLPFSTRFLVDNVVLKKQTHLLLTLILTVLGATALEGLSFFALTQLFSKATYRLIAKLKLHVQEHLARLPRGATRAPGLRCGHSAVDG